jgi:hypothetical protein
MELKFTDTYEATYPNLTDLRNALSGKNAPRYGTKALLSGF